jgi:hypothetical protein
MRGVVSDGCKGRSSSPETAAASSSPCTCDRGLSNVDAEFEEFAVDPRSPPERVGDAHLANETTNVGRCARSPAARSGFPRQKARKPARCQRISVSGLMIFTASSTPGARR